MAMMPAVMPKTIENVWAPLYAKLAKEYLDRLPRNEVVDLFPRLPDRSPPASSPMRWVFPTPATPTCSDGRKT